MPAYDGHIKWLINGHRVLKSNGQDISIAVLVYALLPVVPYPTPVRNMVDAVQYLLKSHTPEDIILSGDSAGGLLVLETLLHHNNPHPNVPPYKLPAGSRFGEAFLVSPTGAIITDTASMLQEPCKDVLNPEIGHQMFAVVTSNVEAGIDMPNPWILPSSAPETWWKDLPVGKITIVLGDWEIFKDDILIFGGHIKKYHDKEVDIQKFSDEHHEQALIDAQQGKDDKEGGSGQYWKKWFQNLKA